MLPNLEDGRRKMGGRDRGLFDKYFPEAGPRITGTVHTICMQNMVPSSSGSIVLAKT